MERLKNELGVCTSIIHADAYIGEWMYRQNILGDIQSVTGRFMRFCQDIKREYPEISKISMAAELQNCQCHECEP